MKKTKKKQKSGLGAGLIAFGVVYALYSAVFKPHSLGAYALAFALSGFIGTIIRIMAQGLDTTQNQKTPESLKKVQGDTGNPEVDKIIEEGYAYLDRLKEANDRIEDEIMSTRISRMEIASGEIFAHITEHPEKAAQIRRFMNYYLPTTLKLLNSYDQLSRQKVKGENIRTTMFEIEGMMETIAGAFETQLDSLFGEDAMDIAADISVMESILQQEGLSGSGKKVRGNAVEAEGPVPDLTFDPDDAAQP